MAIDKKVIKAYALKNAVEHRKNSCEFLGCSTARSQI